MIAQTEIDWTAAADSDELADHVAVMGDAADLDPETWDYPGLTPAHVLTNCGTCGRLLLAAPRPGEPARGFRVGPGDLLPPAVYRRRPVQGRGRAVPECCGCAVAERRANRTHGGRW